MKSGFYPYLLANYPDPLKFKEILELTQKYADVIEIGIPFSDPVADGPVIANAATKVLQQGFSIDSLFTTLARQDRRAEIAIMSYANPILAYGRAQFMKAAAAVGAGYLIVPDVPFEESGEWREIAKQNELTWVSFLSLLTGKKRMQEIAGQAQGFLYLISLTGITGSSIHSPDQIRNAAREIRNRTEVPIALGFGIKSAVDVVQYQDVIDAFIVGSKIVDLIDTKDMDDLEKFYESFRSLS